MEIVKEAFKEVRANKGTYGVDGQSIEEFEKNLEKNLYKLWNRMSSGTYFPKPVKAIEIPKSNGGVRVLGVPTVEDRIAQAVAKIHIEPKLERIFYEDSYGYRANKSQIQALEITRERCWEKDWILEFDVKGLFDNINHERLLNMVKMHVKEKWIILYIKRWLEVPFQMKDGTIKERTAGTPQGGVISAILSNLFMHYVFDDYMTKKFPTIWWARYADDGIAHCVSLKQAKYLLKKLQERFELCGLELNLDKTKIVYCKDGKRKGEYENISFDFLGYTFRPRGTYGKYGRFLSFLPAMSKKASKRKRDEIRSWELKGKLRHVRIEKIAEMINSKVQGWINYYGKFYKSELNKLLNFLNKELIKWVRKKFKNKRSKRKARIWLRMIAQKEKQMFAHWKVGVLPQVGEGSRMK